MNLPGWTCPGIDRVAEIVRRHVRGPDRSAALLDLERLRLAHVRLRAAASGCDPNSDEIERLEAKIRHLEALADQEEP